MPALTTSRLWQGASDRSQNRAAGGSSRSKAITGLCGTGTRWALPLSPARRHQEPPNSRSFQELPRISEHIRVCVRIRPLSSDEANDGELPSIVPGPQGSGLLKLLLLEMHGNRRMSSSDSGELRSHSSLVRSWPRTWEFDWVISGRGSQASVYNLFGQQLVQNAVEGFHGCVIACGPCGSGKSHTIFGGRQQEQQGLVPRVAEGIFRMLRSKGEKHLVKFSYLELYNERLRDLLVPQRTSPPYLRMPPLEVRQHPRVGVFVGNLSWNVVTSVADVLRLMDFGHKMRAVGCTNMNAASSRSHGMATLQIEQLIGREDAKRRWAQLQTVDLAGAARMDQIGDSEVRQRESRLINTSLLSLGLVIKRLSAQDQTTLSPRGHIGCRDNKLTYLLSDSLLGNCRTVMCACVSPASSATADTESALHFAANCRKVFTHPLKNEEPKNETASALRRELDQLAQELANSESTEVRRELSERLTTAQLLSEQHGSWEELVAKSKELETERHHLLSSLGLATGLAAASARTVAAKTVRGTQTSRKFPSGGLAASLRADEEPCLVNICDDPLLSGCLRYSLPANRLVHIGSSSSCQVHVDGLGIKPEMCSVMWRPGYDVEVESSDPWPSQRSNIGALYKIGPPKVLINSQQVAERAHLRTGDVLQIGHGHMFQLLSQPSRQAVSGRVKAREGCTVNPGLVEELEAEFGLDSASAVVAVLQELQPLLNEATDLTQELRGRPWVFQAEVLHQNLGARAASDRPVEPEIVVALRAEGADERLEGYKGTLPLGSPLLTVWSIEKFKERLEALRDLYHEISERGSPWTEEDGNPWEEKSPDAKRTSPLDKGTSTSPPSIDGGTTSPMSFTDASPQEGDDLLSTWEQPRRQELPLSRFAAEPVAPPVEQEKGTMTPRSPPLTPNPSRVELTPTSRTTTPRPPTPMEPMSAPVASEPLTPKLVARIMPTAGHVPSLLPGTTPPVPMPQVPPQVPQVVPVADGEVQVGRATTPRLVGTPRVPTPTKPAYRAVAAPGTEELWHQEVPPHPAPAWAAGALNQQRRDELDAHLGLTTSSTRSDLHRQVRGMPEIADRLTDRWARKTERGLPSALTEYKELAMQLSASRSTLQEARPQTPPKRVDKDARPNSRPKSAPKERRPDLSVHAKRQAEEAFHRTPGLPGQRMEKRAAERAERERKKGSVLKEELARSPRPEREELARLSSQRSRSTLDKEEKTSPGRPVKAATANRTAKTQKREAMPADLFEIPEQLREARRRTSELEAQLAELRKRLQLQENRSAALLTPAGFSAVVPPAPGPPVLGRPDTVYVNPTAVPLEGSRTPSRFTFPIVSDTPPVQPQQPPPPRQLTSRSLSPPRWSAPTMGWTWPDKGAIYAAPVTPTAPTLRVASASPPRVVHVSPSPRVASPVRFIAPPVAMPGVPSATTFWFPRTVSVSPQPGRQAPWRKVGEPNLAKESNPPCTEGWASEPTSSL